MLGAMAATGLWEDLRPGGTQPADDERPGPRRILTRRPFEVSLPRDRACAAIARRLVERHFSFELGPGAMADVKQVTTELVENAYRHGEGEIRLRLQRRDERVRVEVIDEGLSAAIRVRRSRFGAGGQGLLLVDRLASAWGTHEGRAHVWADLRVGV